MSARTLGALLAALLLLGCSKPEREELKRARQYVADRQWSSARDALKQVLRTEPRSKVARGLLVYCLESTEGLEKVAGVSSPYVLYQVASLQTSPRWLAAPQDTRVEAERAVIEVRKALFDEGIDTKDTADLAAVLVEAARQTLVSSGDVDRQEAAAAIIAMSGVESFPGRSDAITFLIERLKGKDTSSAVKYLVELGLTAEPRLRAAVADQGFMGRAAAHEALARVLAGERARALVMRQPQLRLPARHDGSPVPAARHLGESAIPEFHDLELRRVHAQLLPLDESHETSLILLQSWSEAQRKLVTELYVFRDGALRPLAVVDSARHPFDLSAQLIIKLDRRGAVVELARELERTFEVELDAGPLAAPLPGARVRIQGHDVRGKLVREDDGLWIVKVDRAVQGLEEIPVARSSLVAQRPERRTEQTRQILHAELEGEELRLFPIEIPSISQDL